MKSVKNPLIATAILTGLVILFIIAGFPAVSNSGSAPQVLEVPFPYETIQEAIDAASDGDTVVVHPGYYTGTDTLDPNLRNVDLDFGGKAITVRSEDPDEAGIVNATIIDCAGDPLDPHRAFLFQSGEGRDSIVAGFYITNGWIQGRGIVNPDPNDPNAPPPGAPGSDGADGQDAVGGAILCIGSSPTIRNCIIENCYVESGNGGNGVDDVNGLSYDPGSGDPNDPNDPNDPYIPPTMPTVGGDGGDGGDGGRAFGAGIYCDSNSSPLIDRCEISLCFAFGGVPGHAGDGGDGGRGDPNAVPPIPDANGGDGGEGGDVLSRGGAICIDANSGAIISNCIIHDNHVESLGGGGIGGIAGDPNGSDGIDGIDWAYGGGVYLGTGYTGTISNTTVFLNQAEEGGGIAC
ncbi:MAG: hypothetical protein ACYTEO_13875, partial [Planctomycetota bacterium]